MVSLKSSLKKRTDKQRELLCSYASLLLKKDNSLRVNVNELGNEKIIEMVDAGLNDFDVEKDGICLSLVMVAKFFAITDSLVKMESPPYMVGTKKVLSSDPNYNRCLKDLNDVLYIYQKLKSDPKGLNWNLLNAYQRENPDAQIPLLLDQMDHYEATKEKKVSTFSPKRKGKDGRN